MNIGIIGFGLIGASLAHAWKKNNPDTVIFAGDINDAHLRVARDRNLADHTTQDVRKLAQECEIIFLCVPPRTMGTIAREIGPRLRKGAIVSDVGSVKDYVIKEIGPHIPDHAHFIPGHPVAGKETSGPQDGFAELFKGRSYVLTPLENTPREKIDTLAELIALTGANIVEMDAKTHDTALGFTSHMPHVLAFSAMIQSENLSQDLGLDISQFNGGSYEDMTRVATADMAMWRDVFLTNSDNIKTVVHNVIEQMEGLLTLMDEKDLSGLEQTIDKARALKQDQNDKKARKRL